MSKVTFDNKVDKILSPFAEINKITAANMNELKASINALYEGVEIAIQRNTTTATIDDTSYQWNGNTDSAGFIYSLPVGVLGRTYRIANTGTSGNQLQIKPNGVQNLLGVNSNFILNDGEALIITFETTDHWY